MNIKELKRFLKLKKELFRDNKFVIVDNKDYRWAEYNQLMKKYLKMINSVTV